MIYYIRLQIIQLNPMDFKIVSSVAAISLMNSSFIYSKDVI